MNSFFKTPENIRHRRKRLKIMSIIILILVVFNITTKYLLNKLTLSWNKNKLPSRVLIV